MTKIRTVAPSVMAVTLEQARKSLRIDGNDMDAQVELWTKGVIADAEAKTGRRLMRQTWEVRLDKFCGPISLPHPVISITSIVYLDTSGVQRTLAPESYRIKREEYESTVAPASGGFWPDTLDESNAVIVTVVCGYGNDPSATPEEFQLYILAKLAEQFDPVTRTERGTVQSEFINGLLDKCKCFG